METKDEAKRQDLEARKAAGLPVVFNPIEDAGQGFEDAGQEAYAIPFMAILQSNSPQVKKSEGAYIKGAEEGHIINTVSTELLKDGMTVVPVHFRQAFVEWVPLTKGGGFVAEYPVGSEVIKTAKRNEETGKDTLPNGNELVDTRYHYVLVVDDSGIPHPAVVAMVSTQVKKSKRWMSRMQDLKMKAPDGRLFTPPMFSHKFKMTTVPESNDKGSWFGWNIELVAALTDEDANLYAAAKDFRAALVAGKVKEAVDSLKTPGTGDDDDIPF